MQFQYDAIRFNAISVRMALYWIVLDLYCIGFVLYWLCIVLALHGIGYLWWLCTNFVWICMGIVWIWCMVALYCMGFVRGFVYGAQHRTLEQS